MTIEERLEQAEKLVAEVKAELAAMRVTKRNWPERIEAGMVFALFDQLFMPFSHANDGVCRWKICLNDGMISELGSIGSSSTAFGYKGRGSDGLRWSDPTEACMNAADAHESTGAQRGGAVVVPEFDWDKAHEKAKTLFESYDDLSPVIYANGGAEWYKLALSHIHSVSANQVLADGMVGVDREAIKTAIGLVRCLVVGPGSGQDALSAMESALRSAKGETTP